MALGARRRRGLTRRTLRPGGERGVRGCLGYSGGLWLSRLEDALVTNARRNGLSLARRRDKDKTAGRCNGCRVEQVAARADHPHVNDAAARVDVELEKYNRARRSSDAWVLGRGAGGELRR